MRKALMMLDDDVRENFEVLVSGSGLTNRIVAANLISYALSALSASLAVFAEVNVKGINVDKREVGFVKEKGGVDGEGN